jgi:hypothetical protein
VTIVALCLLWFGIALSAYNAWDRRRWARRNPYSKLSDKEFVNTAFADLQKRRRW